MKFFYNGSKKSNEPGIFSGCVLLIGLGALIYFFSLLKDVDDIKEYLFEIILVSAMGISVFAMFFRKKAQLSNQHVEIEKDYFKLEKVSVPLAEIRMDVYSDQGAFCRYHLRDSEGKIAIYSVIEDDLFLHVQQQLTEQVQYIKEYSHNHDGAFITVKGDLQSLYYDLNSGKYTITSENSKISFIPDVFSFDGKYKKRIPLTEKKQLHE